jgi:RNA polymerase sigma factor (sigma-70 family)
MTKPLNTKESLLIRLKNKHDDDSWKQFDINYESFIYKLIRRMNVQHHDAEDIGQNVALKAWRKLPEFDYNSKKGKFRGWLARIAGNEVKDFFRKHKSYLNNLVNTATELNTLQLSITQPDIEKIAEKEWKEFILSQAKKNIAQQLSEKSQKIIALLQEGKPIDYISNELDITKNSIYVQKKRTLEKLEQEIARLESELN